MVQKGRTKNMNTTFFHDTTFILNENNYYTCGAVNRKKFEDYKKKFGFG